MHVKNTLFRLAFVLVIAAGLIGMRPVQNGIAQSVPGQAVPTRSPDQTPATPATQAAPPAQAAPVQGILRNDVQLEFYGLSPALSSLPVLDESAIDPDAYVEIPDRDSGLEGPLGPQDSDGALQTTMGTGDMPSPSVNFDALNNISGVSPPDPVGDIGPNHYVAMSNLSSAIYSRTGTLLLGPFANNALWAGYGGDCQTDNSGDPIVVYDQLADRWLLSQFTASGPTYFVCLAVSQTPDPTGAYFRYGLNTGVNFPDYPKIGIWPDGYYISTREFAGGASFTAMGAYAVNRAQMLVGNPAPQVVGFLVPPGGTAYNIGDGLLPSDLDGTRLPPAGRPNYFMGLMDDGGPYGATQDAYTLWKFHVDWAVPANSTFILDSTIPVAAFDSIFPCSPTSRNCIPQLGTTNKIDVLSYRQRMMHRLAYRNFGTHESLVSNHAVEATPSVAGTRWFELRSPEAFPYIHQQSTYNPSSTSRWMGSIAMDRQGNMALGYSAGSASIYPSIGYTGRLAGDALNSMPQAEVAMIIGTGAQTGSARWGDYTSMNVDPTDDCTFWYINQYIPVTSSNGWRLRVAAFKFPGCHAPSADLQVVKTGTNTPIAPGGQMTYTISVSNLGPDTISAVDSALFDLNQINVPATTAAPQASPYPSTIDASAISGSIQKMTVTLYGVTHAWPDDVDILLVGPFGQSVILMSDAVGTNANPLNSVTLTFDDSGPSLPQSGPTPSGIYKPTDYFVGDIFPGPAPAGPYGSTLSVFNGWSASGDWHLYVVDDFYPGDSGLISGWSINFTLLPPSTILLDNLPAGSIFTGYSSSKWVCLNASLQVACSMVATLAPGPASTIQIFAKAPNTLGFYTNTIGLNSAPYPDPNPANNNSSFGFWIYNLLHVPFVRQ